MKKIRIGQNVAILRKNSHTTQEQLAQVLHISPQAVSKWENGMSFPDTQTLAMIADYFHVTIDFLYYGKVEDEMQESKYKGIRAKDYGSNWLIYSYWKEEDLDALTDEEFKILQAKMNPRTKRPVKGGTQYFKDYFAGKNGELIKGDGDAADFQIYRRKEKMDTLLEAWFLDVYERIFTFVYFLGIRHIYDLGCFPYLQASYLVHSPDMYYTGIDKNMFHYPGLNLSIEESYVNKVFEGFTGSDRIRYIKETYPCDLTVEENSIALLVGIKLISLVEADERAAEPVLTKLASQFDRFVLELVGRTNNTEFSHMAVRDVVEQDLCNYEDIREEQLENLRKLLPDYEFYILSNFHQNYILYGTRIPSDRERILERYDILGDRIVSDLIDRHWFFETWK